MELGEAVQPGTPLISGFDPHALRVETDVPPAVASIVDKLRHARVVVEDGSVIVPQKLLLFPQADTATSTVRLRLDLPEQSSILQPGQFVKVAVVIGENPRMLVPVASVLHRSEITAVYVVDKNGLQLRQVRLGNQFGDQLEVLAGLSAGEMVAKDPVAASVAGANRVSRHD